MRVYGFTPLILAMIVLFTSLGLSERIQDPACLAQCADDDCFYGNTLNSYIRSHQTSPLKTNLAVPL